MMNTALFFIFVSAVARAAPADGNDVAVISDPSAEFRGEVFECHVCHPSMQQCGNRVDCCEDPSSGKIEACPQIGGHQVCSKTVSQHGQFSNVTRGCGKRYAYGPAAQSDNECVMINGNENEVVCNCLQSRCNGSAQRTAVFMFTFLWPVTFIAFNG